MAKKVKKKPRGKSAAVGRAVPRYSSQLNDLMGKVADDNNLTDEQKESVNKLLPLVYSSRIAKDFPSIDDRYKATYSCYADIFVSAERYKFSGDDDSAAKCEEMLEGLPNVDVQRRVNEAVEIITQNELFFKEIQFPLSASSTLSKMVGYERAVYAVDKLFRRAGSGYTSEKIPVSDDTWIRAIEHTVFMHNESLLFDFDYPSYASVIEEHFSTLGFNILTLALLDVQRNHLNSMTNDIRNIKTYYDKQDAENKELEEAKRIAADKEKQAHTAERALRDAKNTIAQLLSSNEEQQKDARIERHEAAEKLRDAEIQYREQSEVNADLRQLIAALTSGSDDDSSDTEPQSDISDRALDNVVLPDSGVVFLGGKDYVIERLKARYPNWTFMNSSNYTRRGLPKNPEIFIIFHTVVGHKDIQRIDAGLPKGTPIGYVSSTNIALLELELKREYYKYCLKQREDD